MKKKKYHIPEALKDVGLKKNVSVCEVKNDLKLIKALAQARNISITETRSLLRYNVISIKQLAYVCGVPINTISYMCYPRYVKGGGIETQLMYCYPFYVPDDRSFKFVFRDIRCELFIRENLGI